MVVANSDGLQRTRSLEMDIVEDPKWEPEVEVDPTGRFTRSSQQLGKGASKVVYKGFDRVHGIEVAWNQVKLSDTLTPTQRKRLFSEIEVLKRLRHRNIMTFYASWLDQKQNTLNFITEYFNPGTLRRHRWAHKCMPVQVLKRWAWQILQGLVYLHGHDPPIIHRDLKCDNIFIQGVTGEVKIGDLGMAKLMTEGMSRCQSVLGTPEYMAPELYDERYNEKVDVYAYGMCLLELVTMQFPYSECDNRCQIFRRVTLGVYPSSLAQIENTEVREFIELCITHNHEKRPCSRELIKHSFFDSVRDGMTKGVRKAPFLGDGSRVQDTAPTFSDDDLGQWDNHSAENVAGGLQRKFSLQQTEAQGTTLKFKLKIKSFEGNTQCFAFPYDLHSDTVEAVALEMEEDFELSPGETEVFTRLLKEVVTKAKPQVELSDKTSIHSQLTGVDIESIQVPEICEREIPEKPPSMVANEAHTGQVENKVEQKTDPHPVRLEEHVAKENSGGVEEKATDGPGLCRNDLRTIQYTQKVVPFGGAGSQGNKSSSLTLGETRPSKRCLGDDGTHCRTQVARKNCGEAQENLVITETEMKYHGCSGKVDSATFALESSKDQKNDVILGNNLGVQTRLGSADHTTVNGSAAALPSPMTLYNNSMAEGGDAGRSEKNSVHCCTGGIGVSTPFGMQGWNKTHGRYVQSSTSKHGVMSSLLPNDQPRNVLENSQRSIGVHGGDSLKFEQKRKLDSEGHWSVQGMRIRDFLLFQNEASESMTRMIWDGHRASLGSEDYKDSMPGKVPLVERAISCCLDHIGEPYFRADGNVGMLRSDSGISVRDSAHGQSTELCDASCLPSYLEKYALLASDKHSWGRTWQGFDGHQSVRDIHWLMSRGGLQGQDCKLDSNMVESKSRMGRQRGTSLVLQGKPSTDGRQAKVPRRQNSNQSIAGNNFVGDAWQELSVKSTRRCKAEQQLLIMETQIADSSISHRYSTGSSVFRSGVYASQPKQSIPRVW